MEKVIKLSTLIVDDEPNAVEVLAHIVNTYCPDLELIGTAGNVKKALDMIIHHQPQLLLLDINIESTSNNENAFDMLSRIPQYDFEVIFVTAYNEYALQAIKFHAFDYLLKPVIVADLIKSVKELQIHRTGREVSERAQSLAREVATGEQGELFWVPVSRGLKKIEIQAIVWVTAIEHYTRIAASGEVFMANKNISEMTEILRQPFFFKAHRSHVINLRRVREFLLRGDCAAVMEDGTRIPISRNRKADLLGILEGNAF